MLSCLSRAKEASRRSEGPGGGSRAKSSSSQEKRSNPDNLSLSLILSHSRSASPRLGIINTGPVECRSPHSLSSLLQPRVSAVPLLVLPRHSFRLLLLLSLHAYPLISSPTSDQFPCPRLGPNGEPVYPWPSQPKTLRAPNSLSSHCSGANVGGRERGTGDGGIKKWSTRNENGDDNTRGGKVPRLTAAAQILDPYYPWAPQKRSDVPAREKRVARVRFFTVHLFAFQAARTVF